MDHLERKLLTTTETLRDIKGHAEDAAKRMEHRSRQKEELEVGQYQAKEKSMLTEAQLFRKQLDEFQIKDREEEAAMRKKKAKIENEVEAWISKYDQEMEEKQTEIDELTVSSAGSFLMFILTLPCTYALCYCCLYLDTHLHYLLPSPAYAPLLSHPRFNAHPHLHIRAFILSPSPVYASTLYLTLAFTHTSFSQQGHLHGRESQLG